MSRTSRIQKLRPRLLAATAALVALLGGSVAYAPGARAASFSVACGDVYGPWGLVAAINAANASPGPSGISLAGCAYWLTRPDPSDPETGLPLITNAITIIGPGATIARNPKSSSAPFRIFHVDSSGDLSLRGATVAYGLATFGGGILNDGTLTTSVATVRNNTATVGGGGIENGGTATINNSSVVSNSVSSVADVAVGGGVANFGLLTVTGSHLDRNTVTYSASSPFFGAFGGGLANVFASGATLTSSTVDFNRVVDNTGTVGAGGGIDDVFTDVTVDSTEVRGNVVSGPSGPAFGGGIHVQQGSVTLQNRSRVTSNTAQGPAADGGGIFNDAGAVSLSSDSLVLSNNPDNCAPPGSVPGCTG